MRAIFDIEGGGNSSASITYYCTECGHYLKDCSDDVTAVIHPDETGFFKSKPIQCPYAGRRFRKPMVELEEITDNDVAEPN